MQNIPYPRLIIHPIGTQWCIAINHKPFYQIHLNMKILNYGLFLLCALFIVSCAQPDGEEAETGEAGAVAEAPATAVNYMVDTEASKVMWEGAKPTGTHKGYFNLSDGKFAMGDGTIQSGSFTVDMGTLTVTDLKAGEGKEKLEGHLKSGDFFEVEKFPTAKFEVVEVTKNAEGTEGTHTVKGNLTMHGNTKQITFPATVSVDGNKLMASSPNFTIDRTDWEISYKSPGITNVQDNIINDEVGLKIELVAMKEGTMAAGDNMENEEM